MFALGARSHARVFVLCIAAVLVAATGWGILRAGAGEEASYAVSPAAPVREAPAWGAPNPAGGFGFLAATDGLRLVSTASSDSEWALAVRLAAWGSGPETIPAGLAKLTPQGERVEFDFGRGLTGWVENRPTGLEQGFRIATPPDTTGDPLRVELDLDGDLVPRYVEQGSVVELLDSAGKSVLRYFLVGASGAGGKRLPAYLEIVGATDTSPAGVRIFVKAPSSAYYPADVRLVLVSRKTPGTPEATPVSWMAFAESEPSTPAAPSFAAPSNDECSGAEAIPAAGPFPYLTAVTDITDATAAGDPPGPSCQDDVSRSVWYAFTPATTAEYTISTCAESGTATTVEDTVLAVFLSLSGPCGGFYNSVSGGCNDDGCSEGISFQSRIWNLHMNAGTTYYILVWKFGADAPAVGQTDVQLSIEQNLPPGNDTCSGAVPIVLDTPVDGTRAGAANHYQVASASCFSGVGHAYSSAYGRDTVYSFTAPTTDSYSFRTQNTQIGGDVVLYTSSDCPAAPPTQVVANCLQASNRNGGSLTYASEEVFCQPLTAGTEVFVFVDEAAAISTGGAYTLEVNRCPLEVEPNDTPAQAGAPVCGIELSIDPGTDVDFFSLGTPPAGNRVFALADGVSSNACDIQMRITTAADTLEFDDANNDVAFGMYSPNCAGTPLTGDDAYIRIDQNYCGAAREPYRLYSVVQPPVGSAIAESEPNDTLVEADSSPENYFSGQAASAGDVDLYAFNAAVGEIIFLSVDGDPLRDLSPIDLALALLDPSGNVLISVDDNGVLSSTAPGTGSLTATTPASPAEGLTWRARQSGTHYARVTAASAGDYLLSVTRDCLAGGAAAEADLAVLNKIDSPDPVATGQDLTYTIEIQNNGPDAASGAQLIDTLPAGTTFQSVSAPAGWSCSTPPVGGTGTLTCSKPSMSPAGIEIFTLVVRVDYCQGGVTPIDNTATVASGATDTNPGNDSAQASTTVTDDGTCDDGLACTENDACNAGSCEGTTKDCSILTDDCNDGVCAEPTGACEAQPKNEGGACETDGLACTIGGTCASGACQEALKDCSAFSDTCNDGLCVEPTGACQAQPANENGACDDSDATTCNDVCVSGVCEGTFVAEPSAVGDSVELSHSAGTTTISWTDPPGDYNVYRGSVPGGGFSVYDHACTNPGGPLAVPTATDTDDPTGGDGFYFLVTRVDQCRESGMGDRVDDPDGVPVVTPRPNGSPCP